MCDPHSSTRGLSAFSPGVSTTPSAASSSTPSSLHETPGVQDSTPTQPPSGVPPAHVPPPLRQDGKRPRGKQPPAGDKVEDPARAVTRQSRRALELQTPDSAAAIGARAGGPRRRSQTKEKQKEDRNKGGADEEQNQVSSDPEQWHEAEKVDTCGEEEEEGEEAAEEESQGVGRGQGKRRSRDKRSVSFETPPLGARGHVLSVHQV